MSREAVASAAEPAGFSARIRSTPACHRSICPVASAARWIEARGGGPGAAEENDGVEAVPALSGLRGTTPARISRRMVPRTDRRESSRIARRGFPIGRGMSPCRRSRSSSPHRKRASASGVAARPKWPDMDVAYYLRPCRQASKFHNRGPYYFWVFFQFIRNHMRSKANI